MEVINGGKNMSGKKSGKNDIFADIAQFNKNTNTESWEGTVEEYIALVQKNSKLTQLSHARVLDMIESSGVEYDESDKSKLLPHYKFFEEDLFGVDEGIRKVLNYLKAAASGSQVGRRILLLYGPTSSGKSQLATLLKNGLEEWSKTEAGAVYGLAESPMHENPLNAVPTGLRKSFREKYGIKIDPLARLSPLMQKILEEKYNGDWLKMPVKRVFFSESNRIGIGTFVPSDSKCVTGDTAIFTQNGLENIEDLIGIGEEDDIEEYIIDMNRDIKKATKSFRYYNKDVIKLSTNFGHSICGTLNHPLMTISDNGDFIWKNMQDFDINDTLVMSLGDGFKFKRQPVPDNELNITEISDTLAIFFGLYIAEGYIDKRDKYVELTNQNVNIQNIIKNASKELGIENNYHLYNNIRNMICSTKLARSMRQLGFKTGSALEKNIPQFIFGSGKLDKVLLGMWLGDGNCGKHSTKETNEATYATASKQLAQQVHLLLMMLGVPSVKYFYPDVGTAGQYVIKVSGKRVNDLVYKLNIPQWKMTRSILDISDKNVENILLFPNINKIVNNIISTVPKLNNKWRRYKVADTKDYGRRFTKKSIMQFINDAKESGVDTSKLEALNDDKFMFVKVNNKSMFKSNVFDIEVPDGHNFIANGFVSHNSQSITELVGSVDFSKLGEYGVESDPRSYKFDGELNVANRGIMEMIEMLKVDQKFLYVLLTLAQEKTIKTERFPLIYADEFIISHTNETEYKKFLGNNAMEALHDRIIVVKFPYNLKLDDETKIYNKLVLEADFGDVHIAPLTLKVASMFAVLSRMEAGKDQNLTLLKKMQLYNGQDVDGFTKEDVKNIKEDTEDEGMIGVSPRYIFNCIADCFTKQDLKCITPVDVLRSIKNNFDSSPKFTKDDIKRFDGLLTIVVEEYTKMAKNEVQKAFFVNFENEINNLLNNYIDNVGADLDDNSVEDEFGEYHSPDEHLMRSIEEKVGVSEAAKGSFRQEVFRKVIKSKAESGKFDYTSHAKLREALQAQLFDERSDIIRLTVTSRNPDPESLEKLNSVIKTLVDKHGYNHGSANELLRYVNSIMGKQ